MNVKRYLTALVALFAIECAFAHTSWEFNVKDFGAVGDGTTDDSDAIKDCIAAAVATKIVDFPTTAGPVRCEVIFPPGDYRVTESDTLMTASSGSNEGLWGLKIRGSGKAVTKIIFSPPSSVTNQNSSNPFIGNLFSARNRARYFHISDMSIESTNANACAFYFYGSVAGSSQNQSCVFERLHFLGNWKRVFGFDGPSDSNLNSEITLRNVSGGTATYSDAFFRVGGISGTYSQQNQFINYWIYDTHFILSGGTLFKFDRGGTANFVNGSWSSSSGSAPA